MYQNPVSSLILAGGTIGYDLQRKIAMPDAIVDDLSVARLHISDETAQTYRNIKARLNAQSTLRHYPICAGVDLIM